MIISSNFVYTPVSGSFATFGFVWIQVLSCENLISTILIFHKHGQCHSKIGNEYRSIIKGHIKSASKLL